MEEAESREKCNKSNREGCFILNISETIDGTREFSRIGRLLNHVSRHTKTSQPSDYRWKSSCGIYC